MTNRLQLLYHDSPSESISRLRDLAEFFGLSCSLTEVATLATNVNATPSAGAVVVDVTNLVGPDPQPGLNGRLQAIASLDLPVLLLMTDEKCGDVVRKLTRGVVKSVLTSGNADTLRFRPSTSEFTREIASHAYPRAQSPALCLETDADCAGTHIMDVGDGTSFFSWGSGRQLRFAWSSLSVHDSAAVVSRESDFECALDRIVPFVIFLRRVFGEACWHNPHRDAGFVIDDPLLTPQYGFIDFPRLLASARQNSYHVTLAFIPWNGWRSRSHEVDLFRNYADCFSICVHGCDHNKNEFGARDYHLLLDKNRVALERMDGHAKRVNMPYSPLMVCPQEQCSVEAWHSFADNRRLLAMVNTACIPRNHANSVVTTNDLLLPAHDACFGFPIFKRYYSGNPAQFALSLFFGKPAILVEHHEYFRDGLAGIEEFARNLRQICPEVRWRSLESVATGTHIRRKPSTSETEVRFFTNRFILQAGLADPQLFRLRKRIYDPSEVRRVLVRGAEVSFAWQGDFLMFDVRASEPGAYEMVVEMAPVTPRRAYSFSPWYHGGTTARRMLSEFRDNVMSRNPRVMAAAQSAVRIFGLKS